MWRDKVFCRSDYCEDGRGNVGIVVEKVSWRTGFRIVVMRRVTK